VRAMTPLRFRKSHLATLDHVTDPVSVCRHTHTNKTVPVRCGSPKLEMRMPATSAHAG